MNDIRQSPQDSGPAWQLSQSIRYDFMPHSLTPTSDIF